MLVFFRFLSRLEQLHPCFVRKGGWLLPVPESFYETVLTLKDPRHLWKGGVGCYGRILALGNSLVVVVVFSFAFLASCRLRLSSATRSQWLPAMRFSSCMNHPYYLLCSVADLIPMNRTRVSSMIWVKQILLENRNVLQDVC